VPPQFHHPTGTFTGCGRVSAQSESSIITAVLPGLPSASMSRALTRFPQSITDLSMPQRAVVRLADAFNHSIEVRQQAVGSFSPHAGVAPVVCSLAMTSSNTRRCTIGPLKIEGSNSTAGTYTEKGLGVRLIAGISMGGARLRPFLLLPRGHGSDRCR